MAELKSNLEASRRIFVLSRHLTASSTLSSSTSAGVCLEHTRAEDPVYKGAKSEWGRVEAPLEFDINETDKMIPPVVRGNILAYMDQIENKLSVNGYTVSDYLPGPLKDIGHGKTYTDVNEVLATVMKATNEGSNHLLWREFQNKYCNGDTLANFVLPVISFTRNNTRAPVLTNHVILSDPEDCERIARLHVQKMPDQGIFLHTGVLSQLDNNRWREQRAHLTEAFLPSNSLSVLFDVSNDRAVKSLEYLNNEAESNNGTVQMNEFLLNETMAQLCLAMFGLPEEMVNKYNKRIRDAFATALEATGGAVGGAKPDMDQIALMKAAGFLFSFINKFLVQTENAVGVSESLEGAKLQGPLSARIQDISDDMEEKYFNAATFIFAGHDTTANTMSWLLYEVCLNKTIQERLRSETDAMFADLKPGEKLEYKHLQKLPFMTRCITETLRKWPVVPNGTFRELMYPETVKGPNDTEVTLPKGTYVQITNWMRHRSPKLWKDPEIFNPDRDFAPEELWNGVPLAGYNPATNRFSPFTFTPRDCMGKNFAQMEMRVILAHLFHKYYFDLASPTKEADPSTFLGVNRATLGPRDTGVHPSEPAALGLYLSIKRRG